MAKLADITTKDSKRVYRNDLMNGIAACLKALTTPIEDKQPVA